MELVAGLGRRPLQVEAVAEPRKGASACLPIRSARPESPPDRESEYARAAIPCVLPAVWQHRENTIGATDGQWDRRFLIGSFRNLGGSQGIRVIRGARLPAALGSGRPARRRVEVDVFC